MRTIAKKAFLFLVLLAGVLLLNPVYPAVVVSNVKTGNELLLIPCTDGEEFAIGFTHSVNKRPVRDYFRVENNHFLVIRSLYDSFGAGMPVDNEGEATLILHPNGALELTNINRQLDDFTVFVGTVAGHYIEAKGIQIHLAELIQPGEPVKFQVQKISYLQWQKGRLQYEGFRNKSSRFSGD